MIRIVESFYLHDTDKWTRGENLEGSTVLDLSGYDLTTSADVSFTQYDAFPEPSTFPATNSTPRDTEVVPESFSAGDSTWESLGSTSEVAAKLTSSSLSVGFSVDSYGKLRSDNSRYDSSTVTTTVGYTDNFESPYVTLEEVTEPGNEYFRDFTVYFYSEAVSEEATPDFEYKDKSFSRITYDSTTKSTDDPPLDMETDDTTVEEESTLETLASTLVTTECYGNVSTGEEEVSTIQIVPPPSKDWHTTTTVNASVVGVSVVGLVVLILWKLRRSRQPESFAALDEVEVFCLKPRQPIILKDELMIHALSVHFTKGARAKILGEDHPVNTSQGQQELIEEVTSL